VEDVISNKANYANYALKGWILRNKICCKKKIWRLPKLAEIVGDAVDIRMQNHTSRLDRNKLLVLPVLVQLQNVFYLTVLTDVSTWTCSIIDLL
jgi:hypothetical protein